MNTRELKMNAALAVANDAALLEAALEKFGRGVSVILGALANDGLPTEEEAPFVFITEDDSETQVGEVDSEDYRLRVVVGVVDETNGEIVEVRPTSETQNGLYISRLNHEAEELLDLVIGALRHLDGAFFKSATKQETALTALPLTSASCIVEFTDPNFID